MYLNVICRQRKLFIVVCIVMLYVSLSCTDWEGGSDPSQSHWIKERSIFPWQEDGYVRIWVRPTVTVQVRWLLLVFWRYYSLNSRTSYYCSEFKIYMVNIIIYICFPSFRFIFRAKRLLYLFCYFLFILY